MSHLLQWEQTVGNMTAKCFYVQDTHNYEIQVEKQSASGLVVARALCEVPCLYEPRWGMDVVDQNACQAAAERLAEQLEAH